MTSTLDRASADLSVHGLDQGAHNYLVHNQLIPDLSMHNDCSWLVATASGYRDVGAMHFDRSRYVLNSSTYDPVPILHQYDHSSFAFVKINCTSLGILG